MTRTPLLRTAVPRCLPFLPPTDDALHRFDDSLVRQLQSGPRAVDQRRSILVSPSDAVVGTVGRVRGMERCRIPGLPGLLADLLGSVLIDKHRDGLFITLRLRPEADQRFYAPAACRLREVHHARDDTWNADSTASDRFEKWRCRSEMAILDLELEDSSTALTLVPIAAKLSPGVTVRCAEGASDRPHFDRGSEIGCFRHGAAIVLFASGNLDVIPAVKEGVTVRMGTPLLARRARVGAHSLVPCDRPAPMIEAAPRRVPA